MTTPAALGLSAVRVAGAHLKADVADAVIGNPSVEYAVDKVTELSFTLADPGLRLQSSGLFTVGTKVDYLDLDLVIGAVEVSGGPAGTGALTLDCRPRVVGNLRRRTGPLVMRRASPSQFVYRETRAAGGRVIAQPSASRRQIARDVPEKGEETSDKEPPSSWSTFRRLAEELGYLCYEVAGAVYFGSPRWLVGHLDELNVSVLPGHPGRRLLRIPRARRTGRLVTLDDVLVERDVLAVAHPGHRLDVAGLPGFDGRYLITSSSYDLGGAGPITLSAETPQRIEPRGEDN